MSELSFSTFVAVHGEEQIAGWANDAPGTLDEGTTKGPNLPEAPQCDALCGRATGTGVELDLELASQVVSKNAGEHEPLPVRARRVLRAGRLLPPPAPPPLQQRGCWQQPLLHRASPFGVSDAVTRAAGAGGDEPPAGWGGGATSLVGRGRLGSRLRPRGAATLMPVRAPSAERGDDDTGRAMLNRTHRRASGGT